MTANDGKFFSQGHCFVAINPNAFADGFEDRMQTQMDQYRNLQPVCVATTNLNINKQTNEQRLLKWSGRGAESLTFNGYLCSQAEGETAVLVAGDPEREHMRKVRQDGGIHYHVNVLQAMVSIHKRFSAGKHVTGTKPGKTGLRWGFT